MAKHETWGPRTKSIATKYGDVKHAGTNLVDAVVGELQTSF